MWTSRLSWRYGSYRFKVVTVGVYGRYRCIKSKSRPNWRYGTMSTRYRLTKAKLYQLRSLSIGRKDCIVFETSPRLIGVAWSPGRWGIGETEMWHSNDVVQYLFHTFYRADPTSNGSSKLSIVRCRTIGILLQLRTRKLWLLVENNYRFVARITVIYIDWLIAAAHSRAGSGEGRSGDHWLWCTAYGEQEGRKGQVQDPQTDQVR